MIRLHTIFVNVLFITPATSPCTIAPSQMLETAGDSPVLTVDGDLTRADNPLEGRIASGEVLVCSISERLVFLMAVWVASCYALNRRYPSHGRRTLSFIETVLLGVKPSKNALLNNALKRKLNVALNE